MALLCPDVGEQNLLGYLLNADASTDITYHLFTNNYVPVEGSALGDFTECVDASYAEIDVAGADWTIATAAGITSGTAPTITFTFAGANNIFGYYTTDNTGVDLLFCERFAGAPLVYGAGGGTCYFDPYVALD